MTSNYEPTRRTFLKLAGALSAGAALAACAPKEPTPAPAPPTAAPKADVPPTEAPKPTEPPKAAAKDVEVRYMSWWGQGNSSVFTPLLPQLKDEMPNVTYKLEEKPSSEVAKAYQTTLVAGTAADVLLHDNNMSLYYDQGLILQLDDLYDRDGLEYDRDFYHGLGIDRWAGKLYGFPYMFNTCIMLYNKTMIQEHWGKDLWEAFPDGNWDLSDMLDVAKACTQDLAGKGKIDQWGLYVNHRNYYYGHETQGWTRGDSIFDLENVRYNFTSDTIRQVNHDLYDWVRKDGFLIGQEDYSEVTSAAGVGAPFYAGRTGMRIRMTPDVGNALRTVGDKFEWDLFHLPNYEGNQAVTRAGGHGQNIAKSTKVPEEAWALVKAMGTLPGQQYIASSKAGVITYRDADLRKQFESGTPEHDHVMLGVVEDKGGYGDHLRFHTEVLCRQLFGKQMDLLYNMPYEEGKSQMDEVMAKIEAEMNDAVDYGDELPFKGIDFPFKPMAN